MWVFGYGSLMWRPGFDVEERVHARAIGFRRCFCLQSVHHRGNEQRSGLVLGLDRGGSCEGMAFRVAPENQSETLRYLREREQVNGVYREAHIPLSIRHKSEEGDVWETVSAIAYIAERAHPSYVGVMPLVIQARQICGARGKSGDNLDYFLNTLEHLRALGIREPALERLATVIGGFACQSANGDEKLLDQENPARARVRSLSRAAVNQHPGNKRSLKPDQRRRFGYRKQVFGGF
ncbi:MAG: gamma-glutamylcyclotransferase [Hyphomicrobiaceae bacterium]